MFVFLFTLLKTGVRVSYPNNLFRVSCLEILFTCLIIAIIEKPIAKLGGRGESVL